MFPFSFANSFSIMKEDFFFICTIPKTSSINFLLNISGEGEFGSVYKGRYLTDQGVTKEVAVKALSKESIEPHQVESEIAFVFEMHTLQIY